jgi:hypothetical protein
VAAYRAAYLVSPDVVGGRAPRVLLVGPTAGYVRHVEGLVRPLDPDHFVRVTHLEELLGETTDVKGTWSGGIGGEHDDVDALARMLAERAARMVTESSGLKQGTGAPRENIRAIFELVRSNGRAGRALASDGLQRAWMHKLPPFEQAVRQRRYLPLMAQCRLAYKPVPAADRSDHIIVDEAQDLSPIEWNVLDQYPAPDGHWTPVGDTNQRRSDTSYGSWQEVADHLAIGDGDVPISPVVMSRGYRSTTSILRFADKLLPARERGAESIQSEGASVAVEYEAAEPRLAARALDVASRLAEKYRDGTTAAITVDPGSLISTLGRQGWRRRNDFETWAKGEETLRILVPEHARGPEFDAVVVVEPSAFPENLGRSGQLYRSLTRANRELAVVWHRGLPDGLRRSGRR